MNVLNTQTREPESVSATLYAVKFAHALDYCKSAKSDDEHEPANVYMSDIDRARVKEIADEIAAYNAKVPSSSTATTGLEELSQMVRKARDAGQTERAIRHAACTMIATAVLRRYGKTPTGAQIDSLVDATARYGSHAMKCAAEDLIREANPRLTTPLGMLVKMAQRRAQAAS